jgi:putative DNA primase/helicase
MATATRNPVNRADTQFLAPPQHTDLSNAQRFIVDHGARIRYCTAQARWLVWDDNRWHWDDTEAVVALAQQTVKRMVAEAMTKQRLADARHATHSGSRGRIESMLSLARPYLAVRVQDLDSDPLLFNVANGTLDLRTGELKPHDSAQLITKLSPVCYDPNAECPLWTKFLDDITAGDRELAGYLQRAVAYSMTGTTCEHSFFMLYGSGTNGKSTFIEAIRTVFGDYAKASAFTTFMLQSSPSAPRNDLAMLCGARLVTATESDDGNQLAEAFVKQVTGGDTVTARFLHKEHFEFTPSFKLWLSTNHRPNIRGTDNGIWRRIKLIPFLVKIADEKIDRGLPEKLKAEAAGILAWAVEGLEEYRARGLDEPDCIKNATNDYRGNEDPVGKFLATRCAIRPLAKVQSRILYNAFRDWASNNNERTLDERRFVRSMMERGLKSVKTKTAAFWQDIYLSGSQDQLLLRPVLKVMGGG